MKPPQPCGTPGNDHHGRVSLFPAGWRCRKHTPAAEAGHPEPPTTPMEARPR